MAVVMECDRDGCPSRKDARSKSTGWIQVYLMDNDSEDGEDDPTLFCSSDCLLQHFARFEVPETIPHD
jgi:hypothetical protein